MNKIKQIDVDTSHPLVSVCMPAYNAAPFIAQAIDSVLCQSYPNIELIVVNDGSTDETASVLARFVAQGVSVIEQSNAGQCSAANRAFSESKGAYIKFMDADDLLSKDFISSQMNRLKGKSNAIASASWGRFLGDDLQSFKLNPEPVWCDMRPIDWLTTSLEQGPNMMQCGLWLIPRQVLSQSGLWDERLSLINDFDFFVRVLLAAEEVLFTPEAVLYYRSLVAHSLSRQRSRKAFESAFQSVQSATRNILLQENSARTRRICANVFQEWKYQFYPSCKDLYQLCEQEVVRLGGSNYAFPAGGKSRLLSNVLGWKVTRRLQELAATY